MIQEFIKNDGEISSDEDADGDGNKEYKVKTHHEIQDFGSLKLDDPKHIGLEEVSPLEGRHGQLKDEMDDELAEDGQ